MKEYPRLRDAVMSDNGAKWAIGDALAAETDGSAKEVTDAVEWLDSQGLAADDAETVGSYQNYYAAAKAFTDSDREIIAPAGIGMYIPFSRKTDPVAEITAFKAWCDEHISGTRQRYSRQSYRDYVAASKDPKHKPGRKKPAVIIDPEKMSDEELSKFHESASTAIIGRIVDTSPSSKDRLSQFVEHFKSDTGMWTSRWQETIDEGAYSDLDDDDISPVVAQLEEQVVAIKYLIASLKAITITNSTAATAAEMGN